jgi:(1->4)-alpha-D-glucan 1-alpha-D-glucosylmutase
MPGGASRGGAGLLATYRLQLSSTFTLADARALVPYLDLLGVSHVYASPVFTARAGSTHGYDVIDHGRVDDALGGEEAFVELSGALAERGMGLVVDLVPNHMCIADDGNTRWRDVLENGQGSRWVEFFDIDWGPPKAALAGKVLLPILGDQFGRELESGSLRVEVAGGAFRLAHGAGTLPLSPPSWSSVLEPLWRRVSARAGGESEAAVELESILRALAHWPAERAQVRARRHERDAIERRVAQLAGDEAVARDLAEVLRELNGVRGAPSSFDALERLVEEQAYRLAHWRVAADEINYRRFFDINDLAAIRVEREEVFRAVHELPARWIERGLVSGVRVDHVDGLLEPARYLTRLRAILPTGPLLVEKILADGERLPDEWPVDGTTGYEHMAATANVLVDADNASSVRDVWRALTDETRPWRDVAYECRRLILETALAAELNVLARRLDLLSEQHRYTRDFTFASLHEALREVLSCFPVYRTYIERDTTEVAPRDRDVIVRAVREATRRNPVVNLSLFRYIEDLLLLRDHDGLGADERAARRDFVLRLQQLTGPVAAKGLEDTAFFRYFPLPSLAEVGGEPDRLGASVEEFHATMRRRAQRPSGLSATATHDTKRGEDARARLHVLSELPRTWQEAVLEWRELNASLRGDTEVPDPLTEVFIYAALVGGWPPGGRAEGFDEGFEDRLVAFVHKGVAEAKVHTSWTNADAAYEDAITAFVRGLLDEGRSAAFLRSFGAFVARIETAGTLNALAQVLLKVAAPGVPDIYWGADLWDFSFADPDNRRPVDWERHLSTLERVRRAAEVDARATARELLASPADGAIKTFVLHRALATRKARPDAFAGAYAPCAVRGPLARHVVAFSRGEPGRRVLALTGRLFARLTEAGRAPTGDAWRDTVVTLAGAAPGARYREALTGRVLEPVASQHGSDGGLDAGWDFALSEVFDAMPLALIVEGAA